MNPKPVVLVILDGFGYRDNGADNAIHLAKMPNWKDAWNTGARTLIEASGPAVGLPAGQMGNSEVGHLNIGAGRIVRQALTKIDASIDSGSFERNRVLRDAFQNARSASGRLHILGLLSDGGVHGHVKHLLALARLGPRSGVRRTFIHAFLDGRDTPPKSASRFIEQTGVLCQDTADVEIASICGRFYAMDRDRRWDRTRAAYQLVVDGEAEYFETNANQAIMSAYERGESDEFVKPTSIAANHSEARRVNDGDVVIFANFRADRARQLTAALTSSPFDGFERTRIPALSCFCSMTSYGDQFHHPVAFEPDTVVDHFGQYVSQLGLRQLRIAETEKYAHVTYFFSGGNENAFPGEDRILVPSPKVATYDKTPEMSAREVTGKLVDAIATQKYSAIICNLANCDMLGHTGNLSAAIRAVETVDECLGKIFATARSFGAEVVVTADHGNVEVMMDPSTGQPHTAHTTNLVPFLYIGRSTKIREGGSLQDVAPTLLHLMGLPIPKVMTGRPLVTLAQENGRSNIG